MDPTAAWSPPDPVPLQEYLAGYVLREAQQVFEAGIKPFVKEAMTARYGADPDPAAVAQRAADDATEADTLRDTKIPAAEAELAAAEAVVGKKKAKAVNKARAAIHSLKQQLWELDTAEADAAEAGIRAIELPPARQRVEAAKADPANTKEAGMAGQALKEVEGALEYIASARTAAAEREGPPPLWLEKCREGLSEMMAGFIHDDGADWDVFTLTSIMQA